MHNLTSLHARRSALAATAMLVGSAPAAEALTYKGKTDTAGDGTVVGKLRLSFSFLRPGPSIYQSYIYMCSSSVRFSAKETS